MKYELQCSDLMPRRTLQRIQEALLNNEESHEPIYDYVFINHILLDGKTVYEWELNRQPVPLGTR